MSDWREWDDFVRSRPDGSVYHLSEWARVLKRGLGYPFRGFALRDSTGALAAVTPLFEVRSFVGRRLVGVPFRDRGGVLAQDAAAERAAYAEAARLGRAQRAAVVLKATGAMDEDAIRAEGFGVSRYWVHSVMTLGEGQLWQRIGKKNRNMVRQAEKAGVRIEWRSGPEHMDAFFALHRATQHRLGIPVFPRAFFEALLDEGRSWARMALALTNERPVAGALFFAFQDRYIYGYSASLESGQESRANDLMLFSAISEAERSGARFFDFGSDSPKQESLLAFKSKWGATQTRNFVASLPASPEEARDSSSGLYSAARAIGRHLPEGLWAALTSPLVKRLA